MKYVLVVSIDNGNDRSIDYTPTKVSAVTGGAPETNKAIGLNPNYYEALEFMSFLFIIADEKKKSFEYLEIALIIDPLSLQKRNFTAAIFIT